MAGKQKGKEDDRYLWPEMLRVIRELRPRCVVGENVPGIIKIAARQVVKDLERAGYHVVVFNFEAAAVGAWHRRSRVFFAGIDETVSDTESKRQQRERTRGEQIGGTRFCAWKSARCGFVCDTMCQGLQDGAEGKVRQSGSREQPKRPDCWATEPDVGRVAHGIPNRVDRIKCLGNAVVPQQAYPIFKALREEVLR